MSVATLPHPALRWDGRRLAILDQTRLPGAEVWLALEGAADTARAIRRLAVRGAPLIGVAAAYGLAMEVGRTPSPPTLGTLESGWELLRSARPTAWELARAGVSHDLVVDGAVAGLMRRGEVDAAIVGADRVAANGDTANKVGTYPLALAAAAAGIPFVVAAPTSTIDAQLPDG